jgi:hypothetical protein
MAAIHFFENKTIVLSQLRNQIPAVDEDIKIKGKKGKIVRVDKIDDSLYHVQVVFEKIIKNQPNIKDTKKKKR